MTWQFLLSSLYSLLLVGSGFLLGWHIRSKLKQDQNITAEQKTGDLVEKVKPMGGPLKNMTPIERSLESSREIKERIEHLLE